MRTGKYKNTPRQTFRAQYQVLLLGDVRYAVLPEATLRKLCTCTEAKPQALGQGSKGTESPEPDPYDSEILASRIADRRQSAGLTQAELARRAGIRVETLNRIERGKTTPDFSTIRKLVVAVQSAEASLAS